MKRAEFRIVGQNVLYIDSLAKHQFTFTTSISFFVGCESETEWSTFFGQFSEKRQVLMPLGNHRFSRKFGKVNDRYGVSWQLNLRLENQLKEWREPWPSVLERIVPAIDE